MVAINRDRGRASADVIVVGFVRDDYESIYAVYLAYCQIIL